MNKILKYCVLLFCFGAINDNAYGVPTYKLVDLGLQESDQSEAVAVNDVGQVAGMYWMLGEKYYFIWDKQNGISLIDLPETSSIAVLNNAGQIAGNYKDCSGNDRGFIWNPNIGFNDIGTLGGSFARVYDMNDNGQIVGESESSNVSQVDGRQEQHAFLWTGGDMIDLGALKGDLGMPGDRSVATSINNQGQIIGTSNSLIAHKRKFLRTNNRAVYWQFYEVETIGGIVNRHPIEEVDSDLEPQYGAWAFSINNHGLATFEDNKVGYFAFNLETKCRDEVPFAKNLGRIPRLSVTGDIFFCQKYYSGNNRKMPADIVFIKKTILENDCNPESYEYVYFANSFDNPKQWKPNSFAGANDFNGNRWVVGEAENIFGEHHAVLLVPIESH